MTHAVASIGITHKILPKNAVVTQFYLILQQNFVVVHPNILLLTTTPKILDLVALRRTLAVVIKAHHMIHVMKKMLRSDRGHFSADWSMQQLCNNRPICLRI